MKSLIMMLILSFSGMLYANTVATNVAHEKTENVVIDIGIDVDSSIFSEVAFLVESPSVYLFNAYIGYLDANEVSLNINLFTHSQDYFDSGGKHYLSINKISKDKTFTHSYRRARDGLNC